MKHPNSVTALAAGSGLGLALLEVVEALGGNLEERQAIVLGGALAAAALFIGRRGLRGLLRLLWRGEPDL